MNIKEKIKKIFQPRLKLLRGTRLTSFLFIAVSIVIAAGILWAANMYYNIDTGEVVTEEIQRVTGILRATAGVIVGGTASQDPSTGYGFQVVGKTKLATTTIFGVNQELQFATGTDTVYIGFKAPTTGFTSSKTYILPQHGTSPPGADYILTWQTGDQLQWKVATGTGGVGDITVVGDCPGPECFTETGTSGTSLWFYDAQGRGRLTIADLTAPHTYTLPDATGTIALGTGTTNYVAYWTDTNTLAGEQYLATSRGGTGANTSAWNGMLKVVSGSWSTTTGTANYAAYWSDANTVAAEQYLGVSKGGTGLGSWTAGGVVYASAATTLANTAAGSNYQILTSQGATNIPSWRNISDLITATNGLTITGTATTTLKLGGTLAESTTITQGAYDMIFNLTGTGDFKVQDAGTDILIVSDDGKIYYKTYPLAESGKQILREMIPIFGFDLPARTGTTTYVNISRTIESYPFSACATGTSRVHKLVIRYADTLDSASTSDWRIWDVTGATTTSSFTVPGSPSTTTAGLASGVVYIATPTIPTPAGDCTGWSVGASTNDWRVGLKLPTTGYLIHVYQVFLAAYDGINP